MRRWMGGGSSVGEPEGRRARGQEGKGTIRRLRRPVWRGFWHPMAWDSHDGVGPMWLVPGGFFLGVASGVPAVYRVVREGGCVSRHVVR